MPILPFQSYTVQQRDGGTIRKADWNKFTVETEKTIPFIPRRGVH